MKSIDTTSGKREYTWDGRKLTKIKFENGKEVNYTYDANGNRLTKYGKESDGSAYSINYEYVGNLLVSERDHKGNVREYFYDNNGLLYAVNYNGENYYYLRDNLSNIIGIISKAGGTTSRYQYDGYGNAIDGSDPIHNPYRYKGYYYDMDAGLYFCESRWYNPEWGRFISPDSVDYLDPSSINGLNMFSYSENNPISFVYGEFESSIMVFGKGHQGNMRSSKYAYWTTEELLARLKELSEKGHLTAEEKKEKKEIETELKARGERNRAKRKGYSHSRFSLLPATGSSYSTPSINEFILNINENGETLVATGALLAVGGLITYVIANDATGVGMADDWSLLLLIPLFILLGGEL